MEWDISAECVSAIIVCIIFIYSRHSMFLPTLKNKVFQICLLITFCSIISNILSTVMIYHYDILPNFLVILVTMIYFAFTPLMGVIYFLYVVSVVYEEDGLSTAWKILLVGFIPCAAYFLCVLTNPITKWLFSIDMINGYQRGKYINVTYIVFYFYCVISFFVVLVKGKNIDHVIKKILLSFPLIAVIVILMQQISPKSVLTGSAGSCSLLIIYLYLQNKQMSIDPLTGLFNRQEFLKMIRVKQKKNRKFTIIVISLNYFRFINDKVGHENGDLFLKNISNFLKNSLKEYLLYRYDGDQFAIFLENPKKEKIEWILKILEERFQFAWKVANHNYRVMASIGIISFPDVADNMEDMIGGLEFALAEAKKKRKPHCYCTTEMLEQIKRKKQIYEILKDSLIQNKFEVYLQPIYSVKEKCFTLGEALLRLNHTELGNISPAEFIPIAEESGIIIELTYWIMEEVCRYIQHWSKEGYEFNSIAINFSAVQFLQEDLAEKLIGIAEKYEIPFSKLKIEITEGILISNFERVKCFIYDMNKKGFRFGLDDFGTGYSNLSSVMKLPFDMVKLDKSLVWAAIDDKRNRAIIRHFSSAFNELTVHVLAEGVETIEQSKFVEECGCEYIQGFYYAKPIPLQEAIRYFNRH